MLSTVHTSRTWIITVGITCHHNHVKHCSHKPYLAQGQVVRTGSGTDGCCCCCRCHSEGGGPGPSGDGWGWRRYCRGDACWPARTAAAASLCNVKLKFVVKIMRRQQFIFTPQCRFISHHKMWGNCMFSAKLVYCWIFLKLMQMWTAYIVLQSHIQFHH